MKAYKIIILEEKIKNVYITKQGHPVASENEG